MWRAALFVRSVPSNGWEFCEDFDVQNKKFITISCKTCGFTELYRGETSDGWNILDFLMGGG
ncbi:MAG: zinc ribbon domain-containing protein [Enterococcus gilvus]